MYGAYGIIIDNKNIQKGLLLQRKQHIMTQDKIKSIHRWYSWILAIIMVALGILFIFSCLDIYLSGPRPYSADAIAVRFRRISIPVMIGCIGMLGGIALNLWLPLQTKRNKAITHPKDLMLRMQKKAGISPIKREIRLRVLYRLVATLSFIGMMIYPLVYYLTPEHFSISELNADIIHAILVTILPTVAGLSLCWICRVLVSKSYQRETAIYKNAIAEGHQKAGKKDASQPHSRQWVLTSIRILIAVAAVVFVVLGIVNGGAEDVLKKAIAICTECIGLG